MKHWTPRWYILVGDDLVPTDMVTAARWLAEHDERRRVGDTDVGDVNVSTVFLGLDHRYYDEGPPLVFETMIFGGKHDQWQQRTSTWAQADAMHKRACAMVAETDHGPHRCGACGEIVKYGENLCWREDKSAFYHAACLKPLVAPPLRKPTKNG